MKKQLLTLFIATVSFSHGAEAAQFYSADKKIESQLCSISANEGFSAARKVAQQHGIFISRHSKSILCNGQDIRDIAKVANVKKQSEKVIEVFATNDQTETQLCVTAVKQGLAPVREKIGNLNSLRCNGELVTDFVKRYHNAAI
ncbi:exonuclease III [Pseudoalteromonas shioyasakiensis]|uniref:exonuclease III n=1 Tax=Pseudoalteromonas shioyasakiensis TaxID=1190813 RepID=UPI002118B451|nr:exonuclease III [Pseudoalteromonas shioyasakiensis]MCQ8876940.1 exonuclease III [Pseudoalteromonas shioyasakiensis]